MFEPLGNLIRLRRIERNLSQERLADMAGVSRGQLLQLEKGENVSLQFLVKVAAALELTELPVDGLRLRAAPLELDPIVRAVDAVAAANRAIAQVKAAETQLNDAETALQALIEQALSATGSTRAVSDAARRLAGTPPEKRRSSAPATRPQQATDDVKPEPRRRSR